MFMTIRVVRVHGVVFAVLVGLLVEFSISRREQPDLRVVVAGRDVN